MFGPCLVSGAVAERYHPAEIFCPPPPPKKFASTERLVGRDMVHFAVKSDDFCEKYLKFGKKAPPLVGSAINLRSAVIGAQPRLKLRSEFRY